MPVQNWSATADENTSIDGINIAEHCPAKNINNAIRSVMAALKAKCDALDSTDSTLRRGAVIGEIRWFAMSTPPEGWLVCNGATVGTSDYVALFAAIGKTFTPRYLDESLKIEDPRYSDPTVFRLPNLMGKVPWGSTSVGTVLDAGLPSLTGRATFIQTDGQDQSGYPDLGCFSWSVYNHSWKTSAINEGPSKRDLLFDASRSNNIYGASDTVQPPALCLLPCIRYE
jgi:microcystin-dependent protein